MFSSADDREVLVSQINSLRDYNRTQSAELAELRNVANSLKSELHRREQEIKKLYHSPTWRTGRLILSPAILARALVRKVRR